VKPAGFLEILFRVFRVGVLLLEQRGMLGLEGIGDVFEEDETQNNMLVSGWLQVAAQLVGSQE